MSIPDTPVPSSDEGTWKEIRLLQQGVRALTWLTWLYIGLYAVPWLVQFGYYLLNDLLYWQQYPLASCLIYLELYPLRNFLAFTVPLTFVAIWLNTAMKAMNRCNGQDGWRLLPAALASLREALLILAISLIIYLAWHVGLFSLASYIFEQWTTPDPWSTLD